MVSGPDTEFEISEEKVDSGYIRLNIKGVVDVRTSPMLRKALNSRISGEPQCLHIVLDEVPRMDSSGIATLLEGLRWSRSSGHRFVLSGLNDALHDLFTLSNLEKEFEIVSNDYTAGGGQ